MGSVQRVGQSEWRCSSDGFVVGHNVASALHSNAHSSSNPNTNASAAEASTQTAQAGEQEVGDEAGFQIVGKARFQVGNKARPQACAKATQATEQQTPSLAGWRPCR